MAIVLTENERELCQLLRNVVQERNLKSTMRIAGGWVRDKLLGKFSDDIDIALDDMTGKEFAEHINAYLQTKGLKTHSIGVIKMNPEQSKHLETATIHISDQWIDLVNLRSETYESDSRIPGKIEFGTPLEDALRRDITINSMFYNVNTEQVEDFTNKGMNDLKLGIIRTPLDPTITFQDDPLRCLRVIRFASRFDFKIEEETYTALSSEASRKGIQNKVSKERIGKELEKMFQDKNAYISISHIFHTHLYDIVFSLHECQPPKNFGSDSVILSAIINKLLTSNSLDFKPFSKEELKSLYLSSALVPIRHLTYLDRKQKLCSQIQYIILESIKLSTKDAKNCSTILESIDKWEELITNPNTSRKDIGLLFRKTSELWKISFFLYTAFDLVQTLKPSIENVNLINELNLEKYLTFLEKIKTLNLDNCWDVKPLFNGKELANELGLKPGPKIGEIVQELTEWQLENPNANQQDAKKWLQERKANGELK